MIRVLQVGLGAGYGGIANCVINYYDHINIEEFRFDFVDMYGNGLSCSEKIKQRGDKIYTLKHYKFHPIGAYTELVKILNETQYDIIHINIPTAANVIPAIAAYRCKKKPKIIIHAHSSGVPRFDILRKIMHWNGKRIFASIHVEKWACSNAAAKWFWGDSYDANNIIPNAIDTEKFHYTQSARNEYRALCGFQNNEKIIGFVGRLCEAKNVLFLPDVLMELVKISSCYKLLIIGDGELQIALQNKVKNLHLESNVCFAGKSQDVAPWYSAMDAFILPSFYEGLPVVGIEAQACGLPCFVSSNVSSELTITELVKFLPINQGAHIWAETIHGSLRNSKICGNEFPQKYNIRVASRYLEKRYSQIAMRCQME